MVKNLPANAGDTGLTHGAGRSHTSEQHSPHASAVGPVLRSPGAADPEPWSPWSTAGETIATRVAPLPTAGEKPVQQ